ncbi:uncharacterized protein [Nerophis lumbriciformis]|uniref:uncharacterized protein isoform X1 n=2 Tax=Nerophis lumbriciformis TaxID=546530 RepID=UPI002ADFAEDA|nr:uncharacterized protein LOC133576573 isoform X1 [Nerophis lumbriciformis]
MRTVEVFVGLTFLFFTCATIEVEWACRDRYLWIHVTSRWMVRFEAVDHNGVHAISAQVASRCGYTISTFKADGYTTFRASYYSCFTRVHDDQSFTFKINVMLSDGGSDWIIRPVSALCSGLRWIHREIVCEEDYMEVNVQREGSCEAQPGQTRHEWQAALSQAQKMVSSASELMFLQGDGQLTSMSIMESMSRGYSLTLTAKRAVLRSPYKAAEAQLVTVDGVPMEVVRVSLFYKQQLMVMIIDMSMACTVNSSSFDGTQLVWDIPRVLRPLLEEHVSFKHLDHSLGVEGVMLDEPSAAARGFRLAQQEHLVQILVPFGAEGGYRKSLVVDNMYKEKFMISLLYEHLFSVTYQDGSSVDTKHRIHRVLDTPLLCRPPFSLDQTATDEQVFIIYLGNIPRDVILEEVYINGKNKLLETNERETVITPVVHLNGSRAYKLQTPFSEAVVQRMYVGESVVQYSIDVNFTLTIMPQKDSYYHHTFVTAQVFSAFPPEITAQCSDRGILFSVVTPPQDESLWEVGVDNEPLTSQLAAQRGYKLLRDGHKTILLVPVFSIGYTYEDINLSNFHGTFKLVLRNARTLEVQTSTAKRCLFKTEDMIVCSTDGTMTVVTTPRSTWPTMQPEGTSLLDRTCRPKQIDISRVLFEFKLDSCGTRTSVGDSFVVYENEILHDRQLFADGRTFISRDSQFKLTVRCFYPLSGIDRLTADRVFKSETPGFGSTKVFGSLTDSINPDPTHDCSRQLPGTAPNGQPEPVEDPNQPRDAKRVEPIPDVTPWLKPRPSNLITIPEGQNQQFHIKFNLPQFNRHIAAPSGKYMYNDSVASLSSDRISKVDELMSDVNRVKGSSLLHHWLPLDQISFMKPTEHSRNRKKEPSERQQPYSPSRRLVNYHLEKRPGYTPEIHYEHPVLQIPSGFIQTPIKVDNHSVNNISNVTIVDIKPQETGSIERKFEVQNIRVKPPRRLTSENLSPKATLSPRYSPFLDSGPMVANSKKHQTPKLPEHTNLFLQQEKQQQQRVVQHMANTPYSGGKPLTLKKDIQISSRPTLGHDLRFLQSDHMSGKVPAINFPIKSSKALNTERNIGSTRSFVGPDGTGLDLKTTGVHDCHGVSGQYLASIHRGIVRAA